MGAEGGNDRRRVFYILDSLADDAVGEHVTTLLSRLPRARYEPRVVALRDEGPLGDRIRDLHVTLHHLPGGGRIDLLSVPRVRKLLTNMEADLVHAFHHVSAVIAQLAAPSGVPVVRYVPRLPTGMDTVETRVAGAVEGLTAKRTRVQFVTGSQGARDRVARRFGLDDVVVVPECIDVTAVRNTVDAVDRTEARLRLGLPDEARLVVAFTGYHDRRDAEAMLDGLAVARVERPSIRLFLVGSGPEESHVRGYAEELQLEDSVVFIRDEAGMPDLLAAASLVVDGTEWPGPSRCGLKAAAAGRPLVRWSDGTDEGDLQADLPTIATVPERFAGELVRILDAEDIARDLTHRSEALARTSAVPEVADRWADLYDDVLA